MNDIDINIPKETTDNTNCLALTVRKEYRLALARNLFDKGTTLTWKIGLSIIVLNFLNKDVEDYCLLNINNYRVLLMRILYF